jgi:hypothetical protein
MMRRASLNVTLVLFVLTSIVNNVEAEPYIYRINVVPNLVVHGATEVSDCGTECAPFEFDYAVANETLVHELRSRIQLEAWKVRQHYIFSWHHIQFWRDNVIVKGSNDRMLERDDFVLYVPHGMIIYCTYPIMTISIGIRRPIAKQSASAPSPIQTDMAPTALIDSSLSFAAANGVSDLSPIESLYLLYVAPGMGLDEVLRCAVAHATPHHVLQMMMDDPNCWIQEEVKMAARMLRFEGDQNEYMSVRDFVPQKKIGHEYSDSDLVIREYPDLVMVRRRGEPQAMHFGTCVRDYHWPVYLDLIPFWGRKKNGPNLPRTASGFVMVNGIDDTD